MTDSSSDESLDAEVRAVLDDENRLFGVAAERACEYEAQRRRHGGAPAIPQLVRVRDAAGVYVETRGDTVRRKKKVRTALKRAVYTMQSVFNALAWRHVTLRSAVNRCRLASGEWLEIDLRLRFRKRLALVSLKTSHDMRKATRGFGGTLALAREAARAGTWRGPRPRYGKPANAKLYGGLAVSFGKAGGGRWPEQGGAWRLQLFNRSNKAELKPGHFQGQIRPSGAKRRKAAGKAKAEAQANPAPVQPLEEGELLHDYDSPASAVTSGDDADDDEDEDEDEDEVEEDDDDDDEELHELLMMSFAEPPSPRNVPRINRYLEKLDRLLDMHA